MKNKARRRLIFVIFLLLLFFVTLFLIYRKKDYKVSYKINGYTIEESYHKDKDYYSFIIKKDNINLYTIINNAYTNSKKIIKKIEEIKDEDTTCIKLISNKLRFNYLCYKEEQISPYLINNNLKDKLNINTNYEDINKSINNITIHNYLYSNYFIWNYKGFTYINHDISKDIPILNNDKYDAKLITSLNDYIFIPDYDQNYYFNKYYLLNKKSLKVEKIDINKNIYFDSYILGYINNTLYIFDKHESIEYKIDLSKKTIEKVSNNEKGTTYDNGFKDISINKLKYQDITFKNIYIYDYIIENNILYKLYDNYREVIDIDVDKIVSYDNNYIYYFKGNKLYTYNMYLGNILLLEGYEWNFNNDNIIFI